MRLNNIHRQTIANRASRSDAFVARETELGHRSDALAHEARNKLFKPTILKYAHECGEKWVSFRHDMKLNVGGAQIVLHFREPTPLPLAHHDVIGSIEPGDLADRIMTLAGDKDALKADRRKAKAAIDAMLNSVSNTETLASVWPEGQQFYSDLTVKKPDLPSVIGTDINKLLGVA